MTDGIDVPCADYAAMAANWKLPDALMGGTPSMRAKKEYLPKEPKESQKAWETRRDRTFLFNAYSKTVSRLAGMPFNKEIAPSEDMPDQVKAWLENIDLAGRNLTVFAKDVLKDSVNKGLTHILAEMPELPEGATLADKRDRGARPYLVHIEAARLIGWRWALRNGQPFLTQVRILEPATEPDGDFGEKSVNRIRVLVPGGFMVFEEPAKQGDPWVMIREGKTSLDFIPLVTHYTGREGFMTARPPLHDLAWLNLEHWQSGSDQRNILHVARVPILFGKGLDEKTELSVGPNSWIVGDATSDLKWVEHEGKAIEAGRLDLKDIEERMVMLGMEPLMKRPGTATATATAIDKSEADSDLGQWTAGLQDVLEQALDYCGQYESFGKDKAGSIQINRDFGLSLVASENIATLQKARVAGDITRETFLNELKRYGVLHDGFDVAAEIDRTENEGPDPRAGL